MSGVSFILRPLLDGRAEVVALDPETRLPAPEPRPEIRREDGDVVEVYGAGTFHLRRGERGWELILGGASFELRTNQPLLLQDIEPGAPTPTEA